jgi:hypothetical protein
MGPVGLPVIAPDALSCNPTGRLPDASEKFRGATPPVTTIVVLYGTPFDPHGICVVDVPHTVFKMLNVSGNSTVIVAVFVEFVLAIDVAVSVMVSALDNPDGAV